MLVFANAPLLPVSSHRNAGTGSKKRNHAAFSIATRHWERFLAGLFEHNGHLFAFVNVGTPTHFFSHAEAFQVEPSARCAELKRTPQR